MTTPIHDHKTLIAAIRLGYRPKYLFFWGHRPQPNGQIGKSCLSQWWAASFTVAGVDYHSAEHYMMAEKARLFDDDAMLQNILTAGSPGAAKAFGRQVRGFDEQVWQQHRFEIVVAGNLAKFGQNGDLRTYLLTTKNRVLVEASPRDRIWGIGLAESNPKAQNPEQWRGQNLLGFALMVVRAQLQA